MDLHTESPDTLLQKLRDSGIKLTHQRMEVFREIASRSDHPDATSIYESVRMRVPTISLDTVYRTLGMLKEAGLITTMWPVYDRQRFDANTIPHHHFVCTECGRAEDFFCDDFNKLPVPKEVGGFGTVLKSHVELHGICRECAMKR